MSFEEMHRRQQAIARRRRKNSKKFSLLLSPITLPSNQTNVDRNRSRMKYVVFTVVPVLFVMWLYVGKGSNSSQKSVLSQTDRASVRNKYWKANVIQEKHDDGGEIDKSDSDGKNFEQLAKSANTSRPFNYIGDYDPTKPKPWPESEEGWWSVHEQLVKDVKESDAKPPLQFDIENESRFPQLIFYGDSITEGWLGTSFGNVPGKHRMWEENEHKQVQQQFENLFGKNSEWGKRALKPPLVLGISGSRTYDFLWRIKNGEFPTSFLMEEEDAGGDDDTVQNMFQLEKLERIYIVLMGTNNLGGGMLPGPTVQGMDAVGRAILQLHEKKFPNTPSAMLFSELLPRKDDFRAVKMCPPRCADNATLTPFKTFMPAIEKVNKALPDVVDEWRKDFENSRIVLLSSTKKEDEEGAVGDDADDLKAEGEELEDEYTMTINCGREMFAFKHEAEFDMYMPDRLHPNAKGYELWSRCLKKGLEVIMDHNIIL